MKKLIVALSLILGVSLANAATATWTMTGLLGVGEITGSTAAYSTTALVGGIAYLFEGEGPSDATIASILAGTWTASDALASKTTSSTGGIMVTKIGSYESETVSMYAIVFDGETIAKSNWYQVTDNVEQVFGATGNKTFTFAQSGAVEAGTGWQAVPEPTSGLLMMVGCALLALKRKRA